MPSPGPAQSSGNLETSNGGTIAAPVMQAVRDIHGYGKGKQQAKLLPSRRHLRSLRCLAEQGLLDSLSQAPQLGLSLDQVQLPSCPSKSLEEELK